MLPKGYTSLNDFVSDNAPICYGILKPGDHVTNGVPVVKVKNIYGGKVHSGGLLRTSNEIHEQYKRAELAADDVLLTIRGTTGRVAITPQELEGANITQDTARIRVSTADCSVYIFYALQAQKVQWQIALNTVGQAVKGINIGEVKKLAIYHPPLPEQRKIAKILSTWDKAIATTEKLIDTSKQQKKSLTQQLLTGKKRLVNPETGKAFEGEWEEIKVSSVLSVRKEKRVPSDDVPLYSLTIEDGVTPKSDRYNREFLVKDSDSKKYKLVCPNDLVYNPANLRWGAINYSRVNHSVVVSPIYEVLYITNNDENSLQFIAQKLMSSDQINKFAAMVEGTLMERKAVKIAPFIATKITKPKTLLEQQKVASVLTSADKEIGLLETKLAHFKQEKKALMQQLLTGKRRVKVVEAA